MNDASSIISLVVAILSLFVMVALWQQLYAIRYREKEGETSNRKWYHLFGKLNEIGFWVKVVAIILFGLVLFVCLHYLFLNYPHKSDKLPDLDYLGVLFSFFAILVTILVGWNIYNSINAKGEMDTFKAEKDGIMSDIKGAANEIVNTRIEDYDHQIQSELGIIRGLSLMQRGNYENAFANYLTALEHQNLCKEPTHKDEIIEYIGFSLTAANLTEWLTQARLNRAINLVSQSNAVGSGDLLRRLASIDSNQLRPV